MAETDKIEQCIKKVRSNRYTPSGSLANDATAQLSALKEEIAALKPRIETIRKEADNTSTRTDFGRGFFAGLNWALSVIHGTKEPPEPQPDKRGDKKC